MVADVSTKPLPKIKHVHCCKLMRLGVQGSGGVQ